MCSLFYKKERNITIHWQKEMQTIVNCEQILFILSNYPQSNMFHIDKSFIKFRFSGLESDLGDAGKVWYHSIVRHYLPDGGWGFSDGRQVRTYNIVWIASCFCPTTLFKVFRFILDKVTFLYYVTIYFTKSITMDDFANFKHDTNL